MKSINFICLFLLYFFTVGCHQNDKNSLKTIDSLANKKPIRSNGIENISLITLMANPEKFEGQKIKVKGYLHLEFEGNGLYINKDDFTNDISKNAVWIDIGPKHPEHSHFSKFNDHYVLLEGTFDDKNQGHMGMMSGSLKDITRLELWPPNVSVITSK